ncbi:endonuclease/exonuclease/phosphatase family protein [Pontibacter arcticus]|uniref:Endonuclease/exonuclease/phosphatase domain-containing protein n=1 Tax=Pontibacter arcticus TaxID=2080288 RepID=A0A364RFC4_9BACT|nr:hypothetical protein [Pontibacter arcticus]RAU82955.1 hypothetical protein DP923_06860 [Pontibacter arcticus]
MRYGIKTLLSIFTLSLLAGCAKVPLTSNNTPLTVAFYNVENLYDTQNAPSAADDAFTPAGKLEWDDEKYTTKIEKLATTIKSIGGGKGPAVIGLAEVENLKVVQDLVRSEELRGQKYEIIHFDKPDLNGLGVALLYKPRYFKPTNSTSIKVNYTENGFSSSGILQVKGELSGEPVTILVTQWPTSNTSRRSNGNDTRARAAAVTLRKEINAMQVADKNANIIVLGDFKTEPRSKPMEEVLLATGRPNPYYNKELFNTFYMAYVNGLGSFYNRGDFQMPDQILVSKSLIENKGLQYLHGSANIHDPESIKYLYGKFKNTPRQTYSGNTYYGGPSDHFPVYIKIRKNK